MIYILSLKWFDKYNKYEKLTGKIQTLEKLTTDKMQAIERLNTDEIQTLTRLINENNDILIDKTQVLERNTYENKKKYSETDIGI